MFTDAIANYAHYDMGQAWSHSFAFLNSLQTQEWSEDKIQEYELLNGQANVTILSYMTHLFPSGMYRARPQHISIETMLLGHEKISWLPVESVEVPTLTRFKEMEIYQTSKKGMQEIVLTPERFAVFYPQDAYMNRLADREHSSLVVKAVITIPLSVLEEIHSVCLLKNPVLNTVGDCYESASSF